MTIDEMHGEAREANQLQGEYNREVSAAKFPQRTVLVFGACSMAIIRHSWRQTAEICSRLDRIAEALEQQGARIAKVERTAASAANAASCLANGILPD